MYNQPGNKSRPREEFIDAAEYILQLTHSKALTTDELSEVLPWYSQNKLAAVAGMMSDAGILIKTMKKQVPTIVEDIFSMVGRVKHTGIYLLLLQ